MTEFFLNILNRSISTSWLILAVLLLRIVLRKAPKWMNVLLWGMVAVRLLSPFTMESVISLIPSAQTIPVEVLTEPDFDIRTGITPVDNQINQYLSEHRYEDSADRVDGKVAVMSILAVIWALGVMVMLLYLSFTSWLLYRRVRTAIVLQGNIYQSENVDTPFVLGIIRPRIVLPFKLENKMENQALEYVILHEQAHIRRGDHWWKILGFILLALYWFNPLMWLAYVLLCRDIELACDEKVIRELGRMQRADYSQALLACSSSRRNMLAYPLAFGEVSVKERVWAVVSYRKPTPRLIGIGVIACLAVSLCFLTNPVEKAILLVQNGKENGLLADEYFESLRNEQEEALTEHIAPGQNVPIAEILPLEFLFASGASSSGTTLTLYPDGFFEGEHRDNENMAAPEYPQGTAYICRFWGRFGEITQIREYAYSMKLETLVYETEVDNVWIEDEVRYIGTEAYGLEGGGDFILYLPDTPVEVLDEAFLEWWLDARLWREGSMKTLSSYGIYNVNGGSGFFTAWPD